MNKQSEVTSRPVAAVPDPSYQPSPVERREDQRVDATFDWVISALTRDVKGKYMKSSRKPAVKLRSRSAAF